MSEISLYLLSIVGVSVVSVLFDIILVEGKLSKYIKSIMGIVLVFVMVCPLPKLLKTDFSVSNILDDSINFNSGYKDVFSNQQKKIIESSLEKKLLENGFMNTHVEIWGDFSDDELKINYVFVDLQNLVLSHEKEHINKYEAIKTLLMEQTGVDEGQVIISG